MKPKQIVSADELSELKFYQYVNLSAQTKIYDVVIIGGSYAGLSAAMTLGRSLRTVLVIDNARPSIIRAAQTHNFMTQDGESPAAIASKAKDEVLKYKTVKFLKDKVEVVKKDATGFVIETKRREKFFARKILFATGVIDQVPHLPGFEECWGISILHCPYCNGYEVAGTEIGIIANADVAFEMVKLIYNWSRHLILFTNGHSMLSAEQRNKIGQKNIPIIEKDIAGFEHKKGQLKNVLFRDESQYAVDAIFFKPAFLQATDIPEKQLACQLTEEGFIKTDAFQRTSVHGVYSAGDNTIMSRSISISAASGAIAGMHINKEITEENF